MRVVALALVASLLPAVPAPAQQPTGAATSYEQTYQQLMALAPRLDRIAKVENLVITRDVGRFTLSQGFLYLLTPVNGRTIGAVFKGGGNFEFAPPTRIEQDRLMRFEKTRLISAPFTDLVILFADSTLKELESKLQFTGNGMPDAPAAAVKKSLEYLGDDDSKSFDPDLMGVFLNGASSDLFYAHVKRESGSPLMFMVNPFNLESVTLSSRAPRIAWTHYPEVICKFRGKGVSDSAANERLNTPHVSNYQIDVKLAQTGSGNLSFAATARLALTMNMAPGPWIPLDLFSKLTVDSARWENGAAATVFRGKDSPWLWVKLDHPMQPGETRPLVISYHGDLIERYGNFFFIKSTINWYPVSLSGRDHALFDLTFHTPGHYAIASVGERTDSSVASNVLTTRWVTAAPIRNASFNLGEFEAYTVHEVGSPPVTIMVSEEEHRLISQALLERGAPITQQRHMKETVAADVSQSLKFFQTVYGPLPVKHFYATESPGFEGLAFPGMIDLSWITFEQTSTNGEDEVFRAHEVAHQWWPVGVDYATYHDQWLSEGFANFSGLWYLQVARKDNDKYFRTLDRWRNDVLVSRAEPNAVWLGYRNTSSKDTSGYQVAVYEKGAWVVHMLRVLMLDLNSMNEDRFTTMMQGFYSTYQGRTASTEDFERTVEQYTGLDMGWFFREWVYESAVPTYRVAYKTEGAGGGKYRVKLKVQQDNVPDDFEMYVPVIVDLGEHREARFRVHVAGPLTEVDLPLLPAQPKTVNFNALQGVLAEVKMVGW